MRLDKERMDVVLEKGEIAKCGECEKTIITGSNAYIGTGDSKTYCKDCIRTGKYCGVYVNHDGWKMITIRGE